MQEMSRAPPGAIAAQGHPNFRLEEVHEARQGQVHALCVGLSRRLAARIGFDRIDDAQDAGVQDAVSQGRAEYFHVEIETCQLWRRRRAEVSADTPQAFNKGRSRSGRIARGPSGQCIHRNQLRLNQYDPNPPCFATHLVRHVRANRSQHHAPPWPAIQRELNRCVESHIGHVRTKYAQRWLAQQSSIKNPVGVYPHHPAGVVLRLRLAANFHGACCHQGRTPASEARIRTSAACAPPWPVRPLPMRT